MTTALLARARKDTLPLTLLAKDEFTSWSKTLPASTRAWLKSAGFTAGSGEWALLPGPDGAPIGVVAAIDGDDPLWSVGHLPRALPDGSYRLDPEPDAVRAQAVALGWSLGAYAFTRYKEAPRKAAPLVWPRHAERDAVTYTAEATALVRDLVNTPAGDMGPPELAQAARDLATRHDAKCRVIAGADLLKENYPAIHAIGRAAAKPPCLIDIAWGRQDAPRVAFVGKGVCFDTGGLDIKPAGGMRLMKKDMGGAAHALGLAHMVMAAGLDVRLRVLIPAVENSIAGNAVYPADVVKSRSGRTIEIGHTDAEGRVVLADALTEAVADKPRLVVDFATLTGAARVALGPDLPALFSNDDGLAAATIAAGQRVGDPVWRLPLWQPYAENNRSAVADISNEPSSPQGGAINAALFLETFVGRDCPWMHLDIMAWNARKRPGRPVGGEAMGMRAIFAVLAERFRERRQ